MIGKIASAFIGEKIAARYGKGTRGALIGVLAPVVARRLLGPLGIALAGGYAARKAYQYGKSRRAAPAA